MNRNHDDKPFKSRPGDASGRERPPLAGEIVHGVLGRRRMLCLLASVLPWGLVGCEPEEVAYTEVKRVDERVTEAELRAFLAIVEELPEGRLSGLPPFRLPLPDWSAHRSLPVSELLNEERRAIADRLSVPGIVRQFPKSRGLKRGLSRQQLTVDQFVGIMLALQWAKSASHLPEELPLDPLIERSRAVVRELSKDGRLYSTLSEDVAFHAMEMAGHLPLLETMTRLQQVPPENLALVRAQAEKLDPLFPHNQTDPLAPFEKLVVDRGVPFTETSDGGGMDSSIPWQTGEIVRPESRRDDTGFLVPVLR